MEVEPNIEWYLGTSRERGVEPRCPFATVERCPRYLASLSLLEHMGHTGIPDDEYQKLHKKWENSDLLPRIAEQDTSISGSPDSKCMSNYCPEVSFESFGVFASLLCEHGDEIDREMAFARLKKANVPIENWKWRWAALKAMHYTECPLYSPLLRQPHPSVSQEPKEVSANSDDLLTRLKRNKWIAPLVVLAVVVTAVATFTNSINQISENVEKWFGINQHPKTVQLPFDSGWILAGYYDASTHTYTQVPYVDIAKTSYPQKQTLPRVGDWVRIAGERNVIIADYSTSGTTNLMSPPMRDLAPGDYTGVKLPAGTLMEVRDIGGGSYEGRSTALWLRVAGIPQ
jgi:hypothetical protein